MGLSSTVSEIKGDFGQKNFVAHVVNARWGCPLEFWTALELKKV